MKSAALELEAAAAMPLAVCITIFHFLTPYRREPYVQHMLMILLIDNDKMKLKAISICRYLCTIPKHTDNIGQLWNVAIFKYQLIHVSACVQSRPRAVKLYNKGRLTNFPRLLFWHLPKNRPIPNAPMQRTFSTHLQYFPPKS